MRFFKEESEQFCGFEEEPEVLESIREKYRSLEENLDEFLFEFVRPCIEGKLGPVYEEFKLSPLFVKMEKEMEIGEMFDWVLSVKQL